MGKWDNLNFKKSQNADAWDFKVKPNFVGKFVSMEENVGPNDSKIYNFELEELDENNNPKMAAVWGSTVLDTRMKNVKIGEIVKIDYLGKEKSESRKGSSYNNFDVFHAFEEDIDPTKEFDGELPEA